MAIDRREKLSLREFEEEYASLSKPVIITGAVNHWPAIRWGDVKSARAALRRKCGGRRLVLPCDGDEDNVETQIKIPPAHRDDTDRLWAGLEDIAVEDAPDTLGMLMDQQENERPEIQLHDHPLDRLCPQLLIDADVKAPKYFPEDYTEQLPVEHLQASIMNHNSRQQSEP